ncbi:MAG TPA: IS630 family transposase [Chromatiaceae bacterium]|jgi:transposase|nr:MAG: hypothetical protein N838_19170 [Thiohalocapsa sp. PB-PSB1]HCS88639.1 IS630 family transposase [Chromatiaceae bacterium]
MEANMRPSWLDDARLIPDEVMSYSRMLAVYAVRENGFSPKDVSEMLGISRSSVYAWLRRFRSEGYKSLETNQALGAKPMVTEAVDAWLKQTVLKRRSQEFGYDTRLWTCALLAERLADRLGVEVGGATINAHLHRLGLSVQKLAHHAAEQTPEAVERFVNQTFPKLQRFAKVIGADIAFEDEAGVDLHEYSGKTWGLRGVSLKVIVTGRREHLNILSTVSARGESRDHVTDGRINCDVYIDFLKQVLKGCTRPLIIVVGGASFHRSRKVRVFIAQHRHRMRLECLPAYSPERHPNEHAWEEIKDNKLARQVIANKHALNQHVHSALGSLQKRTSRILSFFQLPETKYAAAC